VAGWFAIAGAWALAISWPIYQNIASGPEALTGLGLRRPDLLVLIIVVSLLAPTLVVLLAALAGKLAGAAVRGAILATAFALITGLFCWQQLEGSPEPVRLLVPLAAIALFTWLLIHSVFVQNFALCLGLAVPVVILAFLVRYPVWSEAGPHGKATEVARIEAETPVVMVIFDELPLAALENEKGRIDAELFPNFAALARHSNWYPDMTARATNTVNAVPAIMTGRPPTAGFAEKLPPPGLPEYPDNLCRIAESGGYSLNTYEPITDLCRRTFGLGGRVTAAIRRGSGATHEAGDIRLTPGDLAPKVADRLAAPFQQPWSEYGFDREEAVNRFVERLPEDGRSFSLLHIALPHIFWQFMPDGTRYESDRFTSADSLTSPASRAQVNHDMQQMMLQLAYTDSQLGRIIDRMKEQGTWDEALFVVTADHGAGFLPGGSRRILEEANAGWVLPVPLFVKLPGQEKGKIVKGGADSMDIAPTVFDVLGIEPPEELPGTSLAGADPLPLDPTVTSHGTFGTVEMKRGEVTRLRRAAVRQRNRIFRDGELYALAGQADLIGRSAKSVPGLHPLEFTADDPGALERVDLESRSRPSYFRATITSGGDAGRPVAVALNGRIVATTRTWVDEASGGEVTGINLPSDGFLQGANRVVLYEPGR